MLNRLLRTASSPPIRVVLWDGRVAYDVSPSPVATVTITSRRVFWKLLASPAYQLLEGYTQGEITVDGDLIEFLCVLNRTYRPRWTIWDRILSLLPRRTVAASRRNAARHYDLGNDFYALWLDEQMLYTCAYFEAPDASLEAAQVAKMDHVCRKLWLRPGETVIEAGCGWGALARHLTRNYGVKVRAYNVSEEQIRFAREAARREGLEHQIEFIQDDWRTISGTCDAFVSIGMLEHVGPENYPTLGRLLRRCVAPEGRGLLHAIGVNRSEPFNRWIDRNIFPGAQPPTLRQIIGIFEPFDFSVLDVENLRRHYAQTLRHWLQRFERSERRVEATYGETFVRMWRMYLASSISAFETGGLQLYQVVFAPLQSNQIPWTRAGVYQQRST